MAPHDRAYAEAAFEAARIERARLIANALASLFEGVGRYFRDVSQRSLVPPSPSGSPLPTS